MELHLIIIEPSRDGILLPAVTHNLDSVTVLSKKKVCNISIIRSIRCRVVKQIH